MFREIGLADELGSGMRNTYKYTELYSGGTPQFVEGDIFRTVIPLTESNSVLTVGPAPTDGAEVTPQVGTEVTPQVSTEVTPQVGTEVKLSPERLDALLTYCSTPRSRQEMQELCGIRTAEYFRKYIVKPMIRNGWIKPTIPNKPNSRNQKYVKA